MPGPRLYRAFSPLPITTLSRQAELSAGDGKMPVLSTTSVNFEQGRFAGAQVVDSRSKAFSHLEECLRRGRARQGFNNGHAGVGPLSNRGMHGQLPQKWGLGEFRNFGPPTGSE